LVQDELLEVALEYFRSRTGVRFWFQDVSGYTIAPQTQLPAYCTMLINHGRCGLANPKVPMPAHDRLPEFRICIGGIGHLIIPITSASPSGVSELGRLITEPMAIRATDFTELFPEAQRLHIHPDNLTSGAAQIPVVDQDQLEQLTRVISLIVSRIAGENTARQRNLALAEAFEDVGMRANREVINELLTGLVRDFTESDAAILTTGNEATPVHQAAAFNPDLSSTQSALILKFTEEVVRWIGQTGYPVTFPDLGGSAWCRHVLGEQQLEGALAALPVKLPGDARGFWTTYYQHPLAHMEDQLHRLSVLAAHSAQTLAFLGRLETSELAALTDPLTGLHNRRFLQEQLEHELARAVRAHYPVSLVMFDLDNFKQINDTYGHVAGDEALKHVARALNRPLRRSSTICRYGGDEFCVVVPECDGEEAELVADRLRHEIEKAPVEVDGNSIQLRLSGGVATQYPDSPLEADLFAVADQELIRAKREGKGRIVTA